VWTKLVDSREYKLVIFPDGSVSAQKTVGSGSVQRIRDYCKQSLTLSEFKRFFEDR